jgi:thiol-disulfide isomerase/thioredoxin
MSATMNWMKRVIAILFFCTVACAQPQKWPATLQADVKSGSWAAAERVGEALAEEIDAGRMFASFAEAGDEAKMRNLYAEALEHDGKSGAAREQRCVARQIVDPLPGAECAARAAADRDRRIAHLKTGLLASELKIPAAFPFAGRGLITIVAFSATWCAPCEKELDQLRRFENPAARIVMLDVDQLSADERASFVPLKSLLGPEVPRLYVIDALGNIRFSMVGYEEDGFFSRKLDWMIEAIAAEDRR